MSKSTEGVIFTSSQKRSFEQVPAHIEKHLSHSDSNLNSLVSIARLQFIKDIKKSIGNLDDPSLPLSIKPTLQNLLSECDRYLVHSNDASFVLLCEEAIHLCGQGWNYLSYWVSTEQSLCYSIFWSLKASIEKHKKCMAMYQGSKNDGSPKNDPLLPRKDKSNISKLLFFYE